MIPEVVVDCVLGVVGQESSVRTKALVGVDYNDFVVALKMCQHLLLKRKEI